MKLIMNGKKRVLDFNNLYSEIHEVYENIVSIIEFNKKKRELIKEEDLGVIYAEKKKSKMS